MVHRALREGGQLACADEGERGGRGVAPYLCFRWSHVHGRTIHLAGTQGDSPLRRTYAEDVRTGA